MTAKQRLLWAGAAIAVAALLVAAGLFVGFLLFRQPRVQVAARDANPPEVWRSWPEPEVTTPAQLEPPPVPPLPDIYISDLKPLRFSSGWGQSGVNKSVIGKPLMLGGKIYERGLGTHANGEAIFDIPAGARRFVAVVGLDDEVLDDQWQRGSVVFEVYAVNEAGDPPVLLGKSPVLSPKTSRSWAMNVELEPSFKRLELVVSDAGDGGDCDHADWVNAGFLK